MVFLLWIILGVITGWLFFNFIKIYPVGLFTDITLGIAGALVGGLILILFTGTLITSFNILSLIISMIGGIILIGFGRLLFR